MLQLRCNIRWCEVRLRVQLDLVCLVRRWPFRIATFSVLLQHSQTQPRCPERTGIVGTFPRSVPHTRISAVARPCSPLRLRLLLLLLLPQPPPPPPLALLPYDFCDARPRLLECGKDLRGDDFCGKAPWLTRG